MHADQLVPIPSDPHSFAQPHIAKVRHLELDLSVDFKTKTISGFARHKLEETFGNTLTLDTRNLNIEKVTAGPDNRIVDFSFTEEKSHLGRGLKIPLTDSDSVITVYYSTTEGAEALDWLEPVQTADKTHPFLYTQGQAILTRTWIPIQDSPGIRFTYEARIHVPGDMMAVMSAANPQKIHPNGNYTFTMDQPIPGYLMALAVGKLAFGEVGPRTGVYAEPSLLDAALFEFADMENMLETAENLYGKYLWDRYDVIVLPPSFPFGGMENPRLTFATPTILAGDRSLTALIAHELAHSWSGNLVTNATWNDFWLNEGFTVYFERRIMEALYGKEYVEMLAELGYQDLVDEVEDLGTSSPDTKLHLDLEGRNPDDGMTDVAYEKGALFLKLIEQKVGRARFDTFLSQYFKDHRFGTMSTAAFVNYLDEKLLKPQAVTLNVEEWIYEPGIPANCPQVNSTRFEKVEEQTTEYLSPGITAEFLETDDWSTHEWLHFLRHLPDTLSRENMKSLDTNFGFSTSGNSEILAEWFELSIDTGYATENMEQIEDFLTKVGRRKFLRPLYRSLKENGYGNKAREIFAKARQNYHSVSSNTIEELLAT